MKAMQSSAAGAYCSSVRCHRRTPSRPAQCAQDLRVSQIMLFRSPNSNPRKPLKERAALALQPSRVHARTRSMHTVWMMWPHRLMSTMSKQVSKAKGCFPVWWSHSHAHRFHVDCVYLLPRISTALIKLVQVCSPGRWTRRSVGSLHDAAWSLRCSHQCCGRAHTFVALATRGAGLAVQRSVSHTPIQNTTSTWRATHVLDTHAAVRSVGDS
jgi:hypothetical protein